MQHTRVLLNAIKYNTRAYIYIRSYYSSQKTDQCNLATYVQGSGVFGRIIADIRNTERSENWTPAALPAIVTHL